MMTKIRKMIMLNNGALEFYTDHFKYQKTVSGYSKMTSLGLITVDVCCEKYVDFCLNNSRKTFKISDLLLCAIGNQPAGWDVEYE